MSRARSGKRTWDAAPVEAHADNAHALDPDRELRAAERRERDRGWSHKREAERAVLVAVVLPSSSRTHAGEHLDELELLVQTAGARPMARLVQERREPNVRTFIGSGKVEELHELVRRHEANLVVFDDTLSPAQARNLEKVLQINVIDRTEVILDIFARHARSAEAKMQVELAQLQYMRPRLKSLWDHLSRQNGGIGTRGPGETQLEVDRRRVGEKISRLKAALRDRNTIAATQRKQREGAFAAAFVGYTNAGKSSLMNALAGTALLTENKLFSTLDATTRKVTLGDGEDVLLTDTVGFIRKLPHDLVASFRTTLREVEDADLLLHVVDITSASLEEQMDTVHRVLDEILRSERPTQLVFNKIDAVEDPTVLTALQRQYPQALFVSARSGEGLPRLRDLLRAEGATRSVQVEIEIVNDPAAVLSFCFREGRVLQQDQSDAGNPRLRVRFPRSTYLRLQQVHASDFVVTAGAAS